MGVGQIQTWGGGGHTLSHPPLTAIKAALGPLVNCPGRGCFGLGRAFPHRGAQGGAAEAGQAADPEKWLLPRRKLTLLPLPRAWDENGYCPLYPSWTPQPVSVSPPSPFSKGSPPPPPPGTIRPLHSSPNGHLGWQGDPPTPRPDSASGQRPSSGPYPPASQARRRPETRAIEATSNVSRTPQLAESPTKTPPRTPSSHTASSDSRRHCHLGTLSPGTGAAPSAEAPPKTPWEPRGRN